MLDIKIIDGLVVDGSGAPAFKAELGIADGRIAVVAGQLEQEARRTISAQGLHVAPGFIDPHTHSDLSLIGNPLAESKIRQGVTSEIVGNCGISTAPLLGESVDEARGLAASYELDITWRSMAEYLERLRSPGTAMNVGVLIGHNTVRGSVLGYGDVQPTSEQQAQMERLVVEAMEQGAIGLSSGLIYPPGFYAKQEELIGLARAAARCDGIYTTHMRSEGSAIFEAIEETLDLAVLADVRLQISHLKLEGYRNWEQVDRLLNTLEAARRLGVDLGCDQYPYTAYGTWLSCILPYWAQAGGAAVVGRRLNDPGIRAALWADWKDDQEGWEDRGAMREWSDFMITECRPRPDVQGMSLVEIAEIDGKDPLDAAFDLIALSEGQVMCICQSQSEENVRRIMRHPLVSVGSDGNAVAPYGLSARSKPHPRYYGTFPRVLGRYVREEKVLSLEEAVKKMTSITAQRFDLSGRGLIREGAWADITLFDANTVGDKATYNDPHQYPEGIPYVIVNGMLVIDQGEHSGALPGQVL